MIINKEGKFYALDIKDGKFCINEYKYINSSVLCYLKTLDMILKETIKNENGEESNIMKFNSIKDFATYIKAMNDFNIDYIEKYTNV